jgi:hypothetical protein
MQGPRLNWCLLERQLDALRSAPRRRETETADVCLLLEGTYPYVTGGVSSWVHQLVTAMPDRTFALFHIGARADAGLEPRYALPKNVVAFEEMFLFDDAPAAEPLRISRAERARF